MYAVVGEMLTDVMVGAVLSTVTETVSLWVAPNPSVTEASQVTPSAGCTSDGSNVRVAPVPNAVLLFFQV